MPSTVHIANMCSHLQNSSRARLGLTSIRHTKYSFFVAQALHRSGFLSSVYRAGPHPPTPEEMTTQQPEPLTTANVASARLWLGLKYHEGKPVLGRAHTISKSSRLVVADIRHLASLSRGFSVVVNGSRVEGLNVGECMYVATDRGVLEIREALARKVGGTLVCRVS